VFDLVLLIGKTRVKFRSASVRISYALLHLREIPRFMSTQGARGLLVFNQILMIERLIYKVKTN
jgi:hypothetical protein